MIAESVAVSEATLLSTLRSEESAIVRFHIFSLACATVMIDKYRRNILKVAILDQRNYESKMPPSTSSVVPVTKSF